MKNALRIALILLLAPVAGCGGTKNVYAKVKGTVTLNGKPLDKGTIIFSVVAKPATVLTITDGKFSGQAVVGTNTISVSVKKKSAVAQKMPPQAAMQMKAYRAKGVSQGGADPNASTDSLIEVIPAEWNTASKQVREVESGAANEFEFDIKTQ